MIIIVTGVPGVGKTTFAIGLAKKLKYPYIDVHSLVKKYKLHEGYDRKSKSYIVDVSKLGKFLVKYIKDKDNLIIDSHLSHYLHPKYVDLCVVVKCDLRVLEKRLQKRGYGAAKIRENLDAEIFDVCLVEASEKGHKIKVVDTSSGVGKVLKSFKV